MDRGRFFAELREALNHLDDFQNLRNSPLPTYLSQDGRGISPVAAQFLLVDAIESVLDEPSTNARRFHDILHLRYVEHMSQVETAAQLGMSERQVRREQNNAIELLAEILFQRHTTMLADEQYEADDSVVALQTERNAVRAEVEWLQGKFGAKLSRVDQEVDNALEDIASLAAKYHVEFETNWMPKEWLAAVPPVALRQAMLTVLTTLLSHAQGGKLHLILTKSVSQIRITISQTGKSKAKTYDEHELSSLHIAGQLLSPVGGSVRYSEAPGALATVTVPSVESCPVLIVDDNPDARQLFERYAFNSRFQVITTDDVEQAIFLAQEHDAKAIVLDIMMPQVDGWRLLNRLRHHPDTKDIPVAVCTILPQEELAHMLGARCFVQKPISQETFLATLDALLASSEPAHH